MKRFAALMVLALLGGGALLWLLWPQDPEGPPRFIGYVEAETILVAPKSTGRLIELAASDGAEVEADAFLFTLDAEDERGAVDETSARLAQAEARLEDLHSARQRPEEIEALEARRRQADAALDLARAELNRQQELFSQNVISEARIDQARTEFRRAENALVEIEREIEAARLPARAAEIEAAKADVAAYRAALARARTALEERTVAAPRGGRVLDVLYRVGEVVPAGQPVVEILPPENLLARFYVPEPQIASVTHGQRVSIACDGCPEDIVGEVTFIAGEAEFTPPVIFSREERAKLVFLVEARPTSPVPALKPGMPLEVQPSTHDHD